MDDYSLADLVSMTGAKSRSAQLWADGGIIRAHSATERKGTGTHRRFGKNEIIIAAIINVFARRQIAIGELKRLANSVRKLLASSKASGEMDRAIAGSKRYLAVYWWELKYPELQILTLGDIEEDLTVQIGNFEIAVLIPLHLFLQGLRQTIDPAALTPRKFFTPKPG